MRLHYRDGGPSIELYDLVHANDRGTVFEGDVAFYLRQARRTGGPILELGCGTGRVALPLAQAGFEVTGLDLSPHMLRRARAKAKDIGRANLVRGTMERFDLKRKFRLILIPFRAFQHLLTPAAQRRCLECIRRHLAPSGRFIAHLFDPLLQYCLPEGGGERKTRDTVVHPVTRHRFEVVIRNRRNDPLRQVFTEDWHWTERDRRGGVVRTFDDRLSLRWTYRYEMEYLLRLAGFEIVACYGDFKGAPPKYGKEQIWVAKPR